MINLHGPAALSDFLGDFVVYRLLEPADARLPGLKALWKDLNWPAYRLPRKAESAYAEVMVRVLRAAAALEHPGVVPRRLIFLGDTRMLDGTAFANLCRAGDWPGLAFIADEKSSEAPATRMEGAVTLANRWAAVEDFLRYVEAQGLPLDRETLAVIDMDKTLIGARGRNAGVIDEARLQAAYATIADVLGPRFDAATFRQAYDVLNQPAYHPFTEDNQDLLTYVCLVISSRMWSLTEVLQGYQSGSVATFDAFIQAADRRRPDIDDAGFLTIHADVLDAWEAGDPTPFKAFRYREYLETASRFDASPTDKPAHDVIKERILITEEVRRAAIRLRERGVVTFGLSDKPDEASWPPAAQKAQGWQPLHRCRTLSASAG